MKVPEMKPTLDELAEAIDREVAEWNKIGIDPHGIGIFGFKLDQQVQTLMDILKEKGIATEDEIDYKFRENMLKNLSKLRKEIAPQIARAKITEGMNFDMNKLFGPNGETLN